MASSRVEAAKRIVADSEDVRLAVLQSVVANIAREGSLDYDLIAKWLGEAEEALQSVLGVFNAATQKGALEFMTRCLEAYCRAHEAAANTVPLPSTTWQRWKNAICTVAVAAQSHEDATAAKQIVERCAAAQEARFITCFWGCRASLPACMARCMQTALQSSTALITASEEEEAVPSGAPASSDHTLEHNLAAALQKWASLCYMSEHLFLDYGAIGSAERAWLSEDVMTADNDVEVEALIRHTFRRDLGVPTAALQQTWTEYEAFEVDDRKLTDTKKTMKASAKSEWLRGAKKVVDLLPSTDVVGSADHLTPEGATEADALVRSWGTSSARSALRSLGFTMQRLVELEPFPGVLNPSRQEFALHLLRSWLSQYTKGEHRWSPADPFSDKDDGDVWQFVLERHTCVLQWGLLTAGSKGDAASLSDREQPFQQQFDVMSSVGVSAIHCLELYHNNLASSHASDDKKRTREATAKRLVIEWIDKVLVHRFGAALLADLERLIGDSDDAATDESMLFLEGSLKAVLSHVQLFIPDHHAVGIVQDRLEPLIEDMLQSSVLVSARLQRLALRLLNLYVSGLDVVSNSAPDVHRHTDGKYLAWYRRLVQVATEDGARHDGSRTFVIDVCDAWMSACRRAAQQLNAPRGTSQCGIEDVIYERRRAMKHIGG